MMNSVIISMGINVLMVLLLCITIGYCFVLNRRIKVLQDSRGELAKLLKHFDASTTRASESIHSLQLASKKISETIQNRMDKANYLIDDLSYMIEKGDKLANKMEAGFAVSRAQMRAGADSRLQASRSQRADAASTEKEKRDAEFMAEVGDPVSVAVAEQQQAAAGQKEDFPRYALPDDKVDKKPAAKPASAPSSQSNSIGAMLERIAKRKADEDTVGQDMRSSQAMVPPKGAGRSQAERELLEMIKAGMKG